MSTSTTDTQDQELQDAVERELHWLPEIDATGIDVGVDDRVVTLTGQVPTYAQKLAAAKAALRTRSVRAVANDLRVRRPSSRPTDADLSAAARTALDTSASVPGRLLEVQIRDGLAILTGEVMWDFQRRAAVKVISRLDGVREVDDRITLTRRPAADAAETAALIRRAITRHAAVDAQNIQVRAIGDTVELTGTVSSWAEKHQAELAAWSSPSVRHVHNKIMIRI